MLVLLMHITDFSSCYILGMRLAKTGLPFPTVGRYCGSIAGSKAHGIDDTEQAMFAHPAHKKRWICCMVSEPSFVKAVKMAYPGTRWLHSQAHFIKRLTRGEVPVKYPTIEIPTVSVVLILNFVE